ncbi:MAG: hypothetical protein Q9162_004819 [Coniocarpon cinnabarinum]
MRLHNPTLAQYITLTPRLVTPVYPGVAERIVSLLDVHPNALPRNERPIEILEAGTGHGSLTLHLAKALHAANGLAEVDVMPKGLLDSPKTVGGVVHTVDVSLKHSQHAKEIVTGFRRGLYTNDIEFHVDTVLSFLQKEHSRRGSNDPFLDRVILDMPKAHYEMRTVADSLIVDGMLATFCPQVTQVAEGIKLVRQQRLPLYLDQVVELNSLTTGGRAWDVRLVKPRGSSRSHVTKIEEATSDDSESSEQALQDSTEPQSEQQTMLKSFDDWEVVCRPSFGDMITAGGFLAVWRKIKV